MNACQQRAGGRFAQYIRDSGLRLPGGSKDTGEHVARFEATHLPAGAYLVRFEMGSRTETRMITRFARD